MWQPGQSGNPAGPRQTNAVPCARSSSDTGFGRPRPGLDFAFDNFGDVPHRRQLAAHEIPDPEAVIDRETLGRVLNAGG